MCGKGGGGDKKAQEKGRLIQRTRDNRRFLQRNGRRKADQIHVADVVQHRVVKSLIDSHHCQRDGLAQGCT